MKENLFRIEVLGVEVASEPMDSWCGGTIEAGKPVLKLVAIGPSREAVEWLELTDSQYEILRSFFEKSVDGCCAIDPEEPAKFQKFWLRKLTEGPFRLPKSTRR